MGYPFRQHSDSQHVFVSLYLVGLDMFIWEVFSSVAKLMCLLIAFCLRMSYNVSVSKCL